jgi:hypothetical protein
MGGLQVQVAKDRVKSGQCPSASRLPRPTMHSYMKIRCFGPRDKYLLISRLIRDGRARDAAYTVGY